MAEKTLVIQNPTGIHARPAAMLVNKAQAFASKITLEKDGKQADAKSILGVMAMAVNQGSTVTIRAEGSDADQAVAELAAFLEQLQY
ncbi:HPr family phosphocarrier protein [Alicyclobacillus fastidiosus]|uniref:Phosphocarrier protein HPr n=1 Tax=Alicyclobacillus fastidiosus TaxID=392011 RepID=A0ABY6ZGY8_9BACL|nr:HPr family phosphocarrier protein [Alicyclobacillus fastidiosus]WAH42091.1 HPr family phosphocarrier protein [Alicyclobacillus fastidiosus]GMA63858.1 phosphocarrier protein HPr [Alicyclobacillus fastidiosus]